MDSKQLMMTINAGAFGVFEMIYRATQNPTYHTLAMSMLCTTIIFATYSLSDFIAFILEKKDRVQEY